VNRPFALVLIGCMLTAGCMQSIPQPGQTPAQVQACSTDATLTNVLHGTAGSLGAVDVAAGAVALAVPGAATAMTIVSIAGGALAAGSTGWATLTSQAYANDGCAPVLPTGHK
jgi:hypothetical protein